MSEADSGDGTIQRQDPVTVTGGLIYYSVPASSGFAIRTVPVPAACG